MPEHPDKQKNIRAAEASALRRGEMVMSEQKTEHTEGAPQFSLAVGAKVEVFDGGPEVLFVGVVEDSGPGHVQVASAKGDEVPAVIFGSSVQLRSSLPGGKKQLVTGVIAGSSSYFWRLEELEGRIFQDNRRAYRQNISVTAKVLRTRERLADAAPCHVVNISEGGAQFTCEQIFSREEEICLMDLRLTEGGVPFSPIARILRVEHSEVPHKPHVYGCQFINMKSREQERLVEEIFVVQNEMLRKKSR